MYDPQRSGAKFPDMAQVRAVGLLLLLPVVTALAESVSIELTPSGVLSLQLTAADRALSESLGGALGRSLGCKLSDVAESSNGTQWVIRARCRGVFQRRGQVLDGQLKFAGFRQALTKASVEELAVEVGLPNAPFARGVFPRAWDRTARNGVIHYRGNVEPRELPARAIHVAVGYRTAELALIFVPLPLTLFLAVALLVWLNLAAAKATEIDPRALWFSYRRSLAWGLTGLFLLWAGAWAAISGEFGGETEAWALYRVWNGGSIASGKLLATFLYLCPALLIALLCLVWTPKAFAGLREPRHRFLDTMKMFLLPALALIVPAYWTIDAFGALGRGDGMHVFSKLCLALTSGMLFRFAIRQGRAQRAPALESGEVHDRLRALAGRCGVVLNEVRVAPMRAAVLADPVEVENGRVVLSEYALETLEPAEVEAEVARRWSLPLRRFTEARRVLLWFVSLGAGMVLSLVIVFLAGVSLMLLRIHAQAALARWSLPVAVVWAAIVGRGIHRWLVRRAERRAAVLVGSPEMVGRAAGKVAAMQMAPWKWGRAGAVGAGRIFTSKWRAMVLNVKAETTILTLSLPPLAVAISVRAGLIPAASRWPAYLAGLALALLLRSTLSSLVSYWSYRRLRHQIGAKMRVAEREGVMFVGLSPEPRPLVYDRFWDWDLGFLTLSGDQLDYRGEQARFTLQREQVSEIRVGNGAPHWSDPHWIYLSWLDTESGQAGTIPLILPRVRSPWRHGRDVRELHRRLLAWKGAAPQAGTEIDRPDWGLPMFPAVAGTPPRRQLPQMAAMILVGCIGVSLIAHFPIGSEATVYFALVWTANVLWDLFGHRLAALPKSAAV
jgi:hypothetical protein